eukprot:symbB.v1.2.036701.t1/scaffold5212.1/size29773/1
MMTELPRSEKNVLPCALTNGTARISLKAKDMKPRDLSNNLFALANLKDDVPGVLRIVPGIAAQIPLKSKDMKPEELSATLLASAKLKDDVPVVLRIVPAIAAQIRLKAKDMNPQELCIFLLQTAILKDDAPNVLSIVPAIAAQIRLKAKDMNLQDLSNILWASANLKDDAPDVLTIIKATVKNMNLQDLSKTLKFLLCLQEFVPDARSLVGAAVMRTFMLIPKAHSKDLVISLPVIAWACARVELHWTPEVPQLLKATAECLGSTTQVSPLGAWSLCALYESYKALDPSKEFKSFEDKLKAEISKRGLSASDVESTINRLFDLGEMSRNIMTSRRSMQVNERRRTPGARSVGGGGGSRGNRGKDLEAKTKSAAEFAIRLATALMNGQRFQSLKSQQRRPGIADTVPAAVLMEKAKSAEEFVNRLEKTVNCLLLDDAAQIPLKSKDMNPQELCIVLLGTQIVKDDAPDVLSIVPAIAAQIKATVKNMNLQDLSHTLFGLLCRQEFVPDARSLVGAAVMRTFMLIPKAHSKDLGISLPVIAWACARVELHWVPEVPQLLKATAECLGSTTQVSTLDAWSLCALYESYKALDPSKEFESFQDKLKAEISKRGLSAKISLQVNKRRRTPRARPGGGGGGNRGNPGKDLEAKRLTIRMKEAKSVEEFVNVVEQTVDGPVFDYFHASASYHRLVMWKRRGELFAVDKTNLLLDRLNCRVKKMIAEDKLNPQACANVLCSVAHLSDALNNALDVVPAMAAQIRMKAKDMNPQDLSNILWASANLKDDAPDVLTVVPAIAAQILLKAKDMNPQGLSNILWASANLQHDAPDVLTVVPAMAAQIPLKAKDMKPQELSSSLWASANLKDDVPDVLRIVPAVAAQIRLKAKDMNPQDLSNILWASANLKYDAPDVLTIVPAMAAQIPLKAKDMKPQEISNVLWASANLKDDAPDIQSIAPAISAQVRAKTKGMKSQEFSQSIIGMLRL